LSYETETAIRTANEAFVTQSRDPWPANKYCFADSEQSNAVLSISEIHFSSSSMTNDCSWRRKNWTNWSVLFNFHRWISDL